MATDHRVGYARLVQSRGGPQQSIAHLGHSSLHAVQNVQAHAHGLGRPAGREIRRLMSWRGHEIIVVKPSDLTQ